MTTIDYAREQIKQIMEISSANNNYQYIPAPVSYDPSHAYAVRLLKYTIFPSFVHVSGAHVTRHEAMITCLTELSAGNPAVSGSADARRCPLGNLLQPAFPNP